MVVAFVVVVVVVVVLVVVVVVGVVVVVVVDFVVNLMLFARELQFDEGVADVTRVSFAPLPWGFALGGDVRRPKNVHTISHHKMGISIRNILGTEKSFYKCVVYSVVFHQLYDI